LGAKIVLDSARIGMILGADAKHRITPPRRIADALEAWQIVSWYQLRWTIEQSFRVMKSQGLQLEDSQMASAARLVKLAAAATKAACIDIQLTQGRDGADHMPASNAQRARNRHARCAGANIGRQHRATAEPPSAARSRMGYVGHRPAGWVELLLQAARANYLPSRHGTVLRHPSRQAARNATETRCETPLERRRGACLGPPMADGPLELT
jgi:Transposase DDE domain